VLTRRVPSGRRPRWARGRAVPAAAVVLLVATGWAAAASASGRPEAGAAAGARASVAALPVVDMAAVDAAAQAEGRYGNRPASPC
jgi:hypothetical protein